MKRELINALSTLLILAVSVKTHSEVVYEVYPEGIGLSSLEGAIDNIKEQIRNGLNDDCVVILDDGVYYLNDSIVFTETTRDNAISFVAKEGCKPIISGGMQLKGWQIEESNPRIVKTTLDADINNLWMGGERMKKSSGFTGYATRIFDGVHDGQKIQGLLFPKKDFPSFKDISGMEIKHYHSWRSFSFKVEAILETEIQPDVPEDQVLVCIRNFDVALSQQPVGNWIGIGADRPYYFENTLDLLDDPGEFCYDPIHRTLYYFLRHGETKDNIEAVVPRLEKILSVHTSDSVVSNLNFSDIEFSHCNWTWTLHNGFVPLQTSVFYSAIDALDIIPSAISISDARNVKFDSCRFTKLSTNGLHVINNIEGITIEDCEFEDISGTAISVSDKEHIIYSDGIRPVKNTYISNNLIRNIGLDYPSCAAIEAFYAEDLTISHNELYDCPYTGISVGWGWTMKPNTQGNVKVLDNKIIGDTQKCTDGGAIYTLSHFGKSGLLIQGNYIDELMKHKNFQQGAIYADEGSSNVRLNNNVIMTDRRWFFYHRTGIVEVDTTYVLESDRENFGGIDAPEGGTDIVYCNGGDHIFCLPHHKADSIMANAGIQREDPRPSAISDPISSYERRFIVNAYHGSLKIKDTSSDKTDYSISVYGIDGSLERRMESSLSNSIYITDLPAGFHIIVITMGLENRIYKVVL